MWERSSGTVNSMSAVGFQELPGRILTSERGIDSSILGIYLRHPSDKDSIESIFKREGKSCTTIGSGSGIKSYSWDKCTWSSIF